MTLKDFTKNRLLILRLVLLLGFVAVLARFFFVQIIEGERYFQVSEQNRVRQYEVEAPRGLIRDRNCDTILVDNKPAYSVYAIPNELTNPDSTFTLLSRILGRTPEELQATMKKRRTGPFQKVKLDGFIGFEKLVQLEEHKLELPGIMYDIEPRRYYPSGVRAPHLFGYLGEITERELKQKASLDYDRGDVIGKKGIEQFYEEKLRGKKGYRYVEVDALGREIRLISELGQVQARAGMDLILTIDAQLQHHLELEMQDRKGGAVVLNCKNGQVLAMVSKPDYDPEIFTRPIPLEVWRELNNNPEKPLYDRVVQGMFPPGSTYKMVLAIAGLETGLLDPNMRVTCPGYFRMGRRTFNCWNRDGHGSVNLRQAIEQSCNVYFYRAIQRVGLSNWVAYSRLFRFGDPTGIDLYGESKGLVPDSSYFNRRYGKNQWSRGLLLNLAIGQGDLLATPLQMAFFTMTLANRGRSFKPFVVKDLVPPGMSCDEIRDFTRSGALASNGDIFELNKPEPDTVKFEQPVSNSTWEFIHQAMRDVVHSPFGTAKGANPGRIQVAGKTGTAQAPRGADHAWFIGFAPYNDPQVAIAIFLENGGGGGANAAPIARSLLQLLLREGKISTSKPL